MKTYKQLLEELIHPPPTPFDLPEGHFVVRTPDADESIKYSIRKMRKKGFDIDEEVGRFYAYPAHGTNPEELIVMDSLIKDENLKGKGIARAIYKQAELDTGKKIIPDQLLTDNSAALHKKYGLGKEFGLDRYEEIIKRGVLKNNPKAYEEYGEDVYQRLKRIMGAYGLDKFKSISTIAKPIATGAGILGALTAPDIASAAADIAIPGGVESLGVSEEQKELDKKYVEKLREMSKRNKK